jgi:putative addiction module component (TIGR02574 family)
MHREIAMSKRYTDLLTEALKLSEDERAELAHELLDSLAANPPDVDAVSEEEFKAELDRRHEEFLGDPSVGVPWEEVKRMTTID